MGVLKSAHVLAMLFGLFGKRVDWRVVKDGFRIRIKIALAFSPAGLLNKIILHIEKVVRTNLNIG